MATITSTMASTLPTSEMDPAPPTVDKTTYNSTNNNNASKNVKSWYRIRFFRGMIDDVRRRAPFYASDWTDAWDYRVIPATIYMYFAKLVLSYWSFSIAFIFCGTMESHWQRRRRRRRARMESSS